jgi:hypothetical protein
MPACGEFHPLRLGLAVLERELCAATKARCSDNLASDIQRDGSLSGRIHGMYGSPDLRIGNKGYDSKTFYAYNIIIFKTSLNVYKAMKTYVWIA